MQLFFHCPKGANFTPSDLLTKKRNKKNIVVILFIIFVRAKFLIFCMKTRPTQYYKIVATRGNDSRTLSDCLTIEQANREILFCFNYLFSQSFTNWADCVYFSRRYVLQGATRTQPDGTRFFYWGSFRLETQRTTTGEFIFN